MDQLAVAYWNQALNGPEQEAEAVGYPDGTALQTMVSKTAYGLTCVPVTQASTNARWAGIALTPSLVTSGFGAVHTISAIDAAGAITWNVSITTNAEIVSIINNGASFRVVASSLGFENASAREVSGGVAYCGSQKIASTAANSFPANLSDIFAAEDVYAHMDAGSMRPGASDCCFWYPKGPVVSYQGMAATANTYGSEAALILIVRLPSLATGVVPADWELLNWKVRRIIQWEPLAAGVIFGGSVTRTDDAREQLSQVGDYIAAKTGFEVGNTFLPGAQKWSASWRAARDLVRRLSTTWEAVAGTVAAGRDLAAALGFGKLTAAALADHFTAVASGKPSPVVALVFADHVGDARWNQETALAARAHVLRTYGGPKTFSEVYPTYDSIADARRREERASAARLRLTEASDEWEGVSVTSATRAPPGPPASPMGYTRGV